VLYGDYATVKFMLSPGVIKLREGKNQRRGCCNAGNVLLFRLDGDYFQPCKPRMKSLPIIRAGDIGNSRTPRHCARML